MKTIPLDDANYRSVHGRCFYFENERKTFVNSRENCKSKGGKLYEPKDVVEMNEIAQLSGLANWFWIGLRIILLIRDMVVESCYRRFGSETIQPTQNLFK